MAKNDEHILILGGGLAGSCAAHRLSKAGCRVTLIEKEAEVGGLAKSRTHSSEHGEFSYDIGPHRFHSTDERVHRETMAVLGDNVVKRDRVSRILLYGRFFDYPLKLGKALVSLPKTVMLSAIWHYYAQTVKNWFVKTPDDNFENWVVKRFGRKLFSIFFGVYTEKTWGVPCTEISADWASQRIAQASLWDTVKKSLFRPKDEVRSLVSSFHYPKTGGVGEICRSYKREAIEAGCDVRLGTTVTAVTTSEGRANGANVMDAEGNESFISADHILNTMPLTRIVGLLEPAAPTEILEHRDQLRHRSMVFVYLVLNREQVTHDHWIYIPEDTLTVHRISEFKNFSEECAPPDKTLICGEITCDHGDEIWNKSDEELRGIAVRDLCKIGLIEEGEVLETFSHREVFAYPLYVLGYREHLDALIDHVAGIQSLDTTGRQGLFKYNNMDHSIAMGLTAADNILGDDGDHQAVASGEEYFG